LLLLLLLDLCCETSFLRSRLLVCIVRSSPVTPFQHVYHTADCGTLAELFRNYLVKKTSSDLFIHNCIIFQSSVAHKNGPIVCKSFSALTVTFCRVRIQVSFFKNNYYHENEVLLKNFFSYFIIIPMTIKLHRQIISHDSRVLMAS